MISGAVTIRPMLMGRPKKRRKFIDFSMASFNFASEVTESFEKTGYITAFITRFAKKVNVSMRRYPAPYQPTMAAFVIRERRIVSI